MNKNKINFRLVNFTILILAIFLIYSVKGLWMGAIDKILAILFPFLISFAIAYALYPFLKKLMEKGLPKWLSVLIVSLLSFGLFILLIILVIPLLYEQTLLFISNFSTFLTDISSKYEVNFGELQSTLSDFSSNLITEFGNSISSGAMGIVNASFSIIAAFVVVIFVSIYILIDMDKIRIAVKDYLKQKKKKTYNYVKLLDKEITNYFTGMGKNMLYQLIEYTTVFFLIGHPNYLLLGVLSAVTNLIPYFGGFIVNILALIIASVISTKLTILSLIVCLICPQLDSYVIAPRVYGKTNNIHPLVNIFAVFAGGILWGFWGILIALPVTIIIMATFKYFRKDIGNRIDDLKERV